MKRIWTGALAGIAMVASVALLAAQAQPRETESAQDRAGAASQPPITVTGCVQAAEPGATGTAGSASETAGQADKRMSKFVLTNVTPGGAGSAPAGAARAASSSKYPLDADASALSSHIGHRVEITGTFQQARADQSVGISGAPVLKVASLKMVAASCS
jgi:hypothetical protein